MLEEATKLRKSKHKLPRTLKPKKYEIQCTYESSDDENLSDESYNSTFRLDPSLQKQQAPVTHELPSPVQSLVYEASSPNIIAAPENDSTDMDSHHHSSSDAENRGAIS